LLDIVRLIYSLNLYCKTVGLVFRYQLYYLPLGM